MKSASILKRDHLSVESGSVCEILDTDVLVSCRMGAWQLFECKVVEGPEMQI